MWKYCPYCAWGSNSLFINIVQSVVINANKLNEGNLPLKQFAVT